MRILLDTHVALWTITDTSMLKDDIKASIETRSNEVYYSVASIWEIAIKHRIHPENMPISEEEFVSLCDAMGFSRIGIRPNHIYGIKTLTRPKGSPAHHDPFDRLLIAQAKTDGLKFYTHDGLLNDYNEPCIITI